MRPRIGVDLRPLLEDFESGVKVYTREMLLEMMKNSDFEFDLSASKSEYLEIAIK